MKHAAFLPLLTILAALLLPQGSGTVAETCTVTGRVVRADSAEPVPIKNSVLIESIDIVASCYGGFCGCISITTNDHVLIWDWQKTLPFTVRSSQHRWKN